MMRFATMTVQRLNWAHNSPGTYSPGDLETRRPGDPETRRSGDPEIWRSGDPETRRPGDPEIRRPGEPALCCGTGPARVTSFRIRRLCALDNTVPCSALCTLYEHFLYTLCPR